jgi:hypothetical protein
MYNSVFKKIVSRSVKYEIKRKLNLTKYLIQSYAFWKWRSSHFFLNSAQINYIGNQDNITQLKGLLGVKDQATVAENFQRKYTSKCYRLSGTQCTMCARNANHHS